MLISRYGMQMDYWVCNVPVHLRGFHSENDIFIINLIWYADIYIWYAKGVLKYANGLLGMRYGMQMEFWVCNIHVEFRCLYKEFWRGVMDHTNTKNRI